MYALLQSDTMIFRNIVEKSEYSFFAKAANIH